MSTQPEGRRARGKRERAARIAEAAARLFDESPFPEVTTQAIAQAADVAEGTLFRYACSKTELLVMALNTRFDAALDAGLAAAARRDPLDTVGRLDALAGALLFIGADRPDNAALYQRELLFPTMSGDYLTEGERIARRWEQAIAEPFEDLAAAQPQASPQASEAPTEPTAVGHVSTPARLAGSAAWDAIQLSVARRARAGLPPLSRADLRGQFELLARALTRPEVVTNTTNTQQESR
ncbi:MAG: TetR/AcrR family transcriptional regulator [Arthrobacter sp.]|jgi:AcrR family transcriptional regulator|nr:TetR/AcrR family transcriptional regulator [Arthrobacter sp.]